ncbi:MAG: hypothetical protein J5950_05375 [Clostridia bacterium]|nr:hypothetical protein [Clostridia bacterium]
MILTLYPAFRRWSEKGSVYIISDTHFGDADCALMDPAWITPEEHIAIIEKLAGKNDTLIHLGDVGDPEYIARLRCYKVLLLGNHDEGASKFEPFFDEIYSGPLFVGEKLLLSHEPIYGLEKWCVNIHGHDHSGAGSPSHLNVASNVCGYEPVSLGKLIKRGLLGKVESIHRLTIDDAVKNKLKRQDQSVKDF